MINLPRQKTSEELEDLEKIKPLSEVDEAIKRLGSLVRLLREQAGISQVRLSAAYNSTSASVSNTETRGITPSPKHLAALKLLAGLPDYSMDRIIELIMQVKTLQLKQAMRQHEEKMLSNGEKSIRKAPFVCGNKKCKSVLKNSYDIFGEIKFLAGSKYVAIVDCKKCRTKSYVFIRKGRAWRKPDARELRLAVRNKKEQK